MIGFVCKYAPVEVFEAMDTEVGRISPSVVNFNQADTLMHPNVCSFVKSVLEEVIGSDYEGVILTTCCDSVRRLCDVLRDQCPDKFIYMIDVPRKVNDFSSKMFTENLRKMIRAYEDFSGKKFDEKKFAQILERKAEAEKLRKAPEKEDGPRIGLVGTRCSAGVLNILENHHAQILFDMTCTGLSRSFRCGQEDPLGAYAWDLLNQVPCLRMVKASGREKFIDGFKDRLDGLICHTVKFCDMYAFEYSELRAGAGVPVLQAETDSTAQSEGQIRTRVEAFLESVKKPEIGKKKRTVTRTGSEKMYVLGVDSGSTSTNAVILDENKKMLLLMWFGPEPRAERARIRSCRMFWIRRGSARTSLLLSFRPGTDVSASLTRMRT